MTVPVPDAETSQDVNETRRFVVCGDDTLAYRLADELLNRHNGHVTVIMPSRERGYGARIARLPGINVIESDLPDEEAFAEAELATADALGLVARNDLGNIDAALSAHEINPQLRIVVRMFNTGLSAGVAELPYCTVLSDTAIAAPAFVAAAMGDTAPPRLRNDSMFVAARSEVPEADVLCGLAITAGRDDEEMLPADQDAADVVLARVRRPAPLPRRRTRRLTHHYPIRAVVARIWFRLRIVIGVFVSLLAAGTLALALVRTDLSPWEAAYTAMLVAFSGSDANPDASIVEQVTRTVLAFASILLVPLLTATVVDAVVKSRLELAEGSLTKRASGHVVVAGLGGIGSAVVTTLHEMGLDVVAIDRTPDALGTQLTKDLHIPLIIGDASRKETLLRASVPTCRALMAITTDDMTNLETALTARSIRRDVPIVLRLFDGDFAERIQRAFDITTSRSVSYVAAPAFAARMLGQGSDTVSIGRHVLLIADLVVGPYSVLEGQTVADVRRPHQARLIEVTNPQGQRLPSTVPGGRRLQRGDRLLVVATRRGLARLIAETATPPDTAPRTPIVIHDAFPGRQAPPPPRPRPSPSE